MEKCTDSCSPIVSSPDTLSSSLSTTPEASKDSSFPILPVVGGGLGAGGILGSIFVSQSNSSMSAVAPTSPGVPVPLEDSAFSLSFAALLLLVIWRLKWKRKSGIPQSLKNLE
jgi:hypothetical protein